MSADTALSLTDVVVTRSGRNILDHLSLEAACGTVTALLGPNGAGKTTAIRCLTGVFRPRSGEVVVLGRPAGHPDALTRLGLMPQSTGAWSGIRPRHLLRYLGSLYADPQPLTDLAALLALDSFLDTPYRRLSGGQQQAVNLAGALIGRPELVVLDEPTAGMDPHARRRTWSVIEDLAAAGVTVLLTTHDMEEAASLAEQVWIIDSGRVVVHGRVQDLAVDGSLEETFLRHTRERP